MTPSLEITGELLARLREALLEDLGDEDLTTAAVVAPGRSAKGRVIAKSPGIFCGFPVFEAIFRLLDEGLG